MSIIKAKNSAPAIKKIPAELKNEKIKNITEFTGFFDVITSKAEPRIKKEKMKNKIEANICI